MKNIKTLLNLDNKLNKSLTNGKSKQIFSAVCQILLSVILSVLYFGFFHLLGDTNNSQNYLSSFISIIQVVLFLQIVSNIIKNVYMINDRVLLSFMPISPSEIYFARLINCIKNCYKLNFLLTFPAFIVYGVLFNFSISFYLLGIIAILLIPIISIGLAIILATPIMIVYNWLRNKNIINLIFSIILTIVGFYFYSKLIFNMADIIILEYKKSNLLLLFTNIFQSTYFPSTWIVRFISLSGFLKYFILSFVISLGSLILGIFLGITTYNRIFRNLVVNETYANTYKSRTKKKNAFLSHFLTELKEIFRSSSYAFTYFGMSIAMPIMVLICNSFIVEFAIEKLGHQIIFGTTLFVVLVFISIICSPSAVFISKEGKSFWLLKTNPKGITLPIFAKALVSIILSMSSLILTLVLMIVLKYLTIAGAFAILLLAGIFMLSIINLGLYLNLLRPNLFTTSVHNFSNMATLMLIGFLISIVIGVLSIILSFYETISLIVIINFVILIVFAVSMFLLLKLNYEKLFYRTEV